MKRIPFIKMSGAGNDFIVVEAPKINGLALKKFATKVCNRTNGLGADGLLVLDKSKNADYKMRIINADGSEAEMCGNGAYCLTAYIIKNRRLNKKYLTLETLAGIVEGQERDRGAYVHLSDPVHYTPDISADVKGRKIHMSYIDTGVPHVIIYVDHLQQINVKDIGATIRYHKRFRPKGTNVNFVEQINKDFIDIRTYERGVEDETNACGTGSVAAAIITYLKANPTTENKKKAKIRVRTRSKEILEVIFDVINQKVSNVWLKGRAKFIAKGEYYV